MSANPNISASSWYSSRMPHSCFFWGFHSIRGFWLNFACMCFLFLFLFYSSCYRSLSPILSLVSMLSFLSLFSPSLSQMLFLFLHAVIRHLSVFLSHLGLKFNSGSVLSAPLSLSHTPLLLSQTLSLHIFFWFSFSIQNLPAVLWFHPS